ncbi:hypothetical protein G6F57_021880 [Rhizopus arrhizus]|nr:hypothetical protein G6F57_021880 [Rhizopus arrhizus]
MTPILTDLQTLGQQQDALGALALGFLGVGDGGAGGAARACQDGHLAGAGLHGGAHDVRILLGSQGEELAGAACGKEGGGAVRSQPFEAGGVGLGVEIAVLVKVRHGEGQQPFRHDFFEFLRGSHSALIRCDRRGLCCRERCTVLKR